MAKINDEEFLYNELSETLKFPQSGVRNKTQIKRRIRDTGFKRRRKINISSEKSNSSS